MRVRPTPHWPDPRVVALVLSPVPLEVPHMLHLRRELNEGVAVEAQSHGADGMGVVWRREGERELA